MKDVFKIIGFISIVGFVITSTIILRGSNELIYYFDISSLLMLAMGIVGTNLLYFGKNVMKYFNGNLEYNIYKLTFKASLLISPVISIIVYASAYNSMKVDNSLTAMVYLSESVMVALLPILYGFSVSLICLVLDKEPLGK